MKNNLRNKKKKGFTLIELIIVIAIIAILAAIAIPRFGSATQDAKLKSDIANAKNIANAVTMAIADGDPFGEDAVAVTEANLGDELQSIPVPSTGGTFFVRVIDGDVIVYTDDASGTEPIYPEGSDEVMP